MLTRQIYQMNHNHICRDEWISGHYSTKCVKGMDTVCVI